MSTTTPGPNRETRRHPHRPPLDVAGAAEYLGTSERHVRRLANERRLAFIRLGAKLRFSPDDLDAWLDAQRVEATNGPGAA